MALIGLTLARPVFCRHGTFHEPRSLYVSQELLNAQPISWNHRPISTHDRLRFHEVTDFIVNDREYCADTGICELALILEPMERRFDLRGTTRLSMGVTPSQSTGVTRTNIKQMSLTA